MQPLGEFRIRAHSAVATASPSPAPPLATPPSAEYALRGRRGLPSCSPRRRMTAFQRAQMFSDLQNIVNVAVDGVLARPGTSLGRRQHDADFKATRHVGAVNSINWARSARPGLLLLSLPGCAVTEEGGLGRLVEGERRRASQSRQRRARAHIARQMGCVGHPRRVATNENDVPTSSFRTGASTASSSADTLATSPARPWINSPRPRTGASSSTYNATATHQPSSTRPWPAICHFLTCPARLSSPLLCATLPRFSSPAPSFACRTLPPRSRAEKGKRLPPRLRTRPTACTSLARCARRSRARSLSGDCAARQAADTILQATGHLPPRARSAWKASKAREERAHGAGHLAEGPQRLSANACAPAPEFFFTRCVFEPTCEPARLRGRGPGPVTYSLGSLFPALLPARIDAMLHPDDSKSARIQPLNPVTPARSASTCVAPLRRGSPHAATCARRLPTP